jgi:GH15 family glucan-1,4-alpha-glucosidase
MPARIEDYALIGDLETAALVSKQGSIDWLCWPRFDSDACFAALLGDERHGRWLISPRDPHAQISRQYRRDTLILETRFVTATGSVLLVDFMPPRSHHSDVVRLVIGERGHVDLHTTLTLRFGYGAIVPWVTRIGPHTWRAIAGPDMVILRTPVELRGEDLHSVADFTVAAGQVVPFSLVYTYSHQSIPQEVPLHTRLHATETFWTEWVAQCADSGRHREAVIRSLITLRALIYAPTGGIIAAPTTSLPERSGGVRNWDYRYCWLRDATLTLLAFMNAGYSKEATAWRDWLVRAVAGTAEQMQIMYGVAGERRLTEWEASWLPGYCQSHPVRIGNAASQQRQLDVYGEVMDALHQARQAGLGATEHAWATQRALLEDLREKWSQPDNGLWEMRGSPRHFTHSKVMAWVAFDRGIKAVERFGLPGPVDAWRKARAEIHHDICTNGFDRSRNTFVQSYGGDTLDASLLLLPAVGFLPATDPRMRGTIAAIERHLLRDGLVLRYHHKEARDGLPPGEGAFLACSFWLADAYAMGGRLQDAERMLERLLGLRNDVGLLAEEYDAQRGQLLGNFPQAFSHMALINTAYNLARADKPAAQRSEQPMPVS